VSRRGQDSALHYGNPAARFDEGEFAEEADFLLGAQSFVEIEEVHAAAQEYVLAVIDYFGVFTGDRPTGGAAAEEVAGFVDFDFEPGTAEGGCGGKAGEATADNDYARQSLLSLSTWNGSRWISDFMRDAGPSERAREVERS
jgi:hypothetical protein